MQAGFAVDLSHPPMPPAVRELLSLHPKVSEKYPRKRETVVRAVGTLPDESAGQVQLATLGGPQLNGFTFDSLEPNGNIERSITLADGKLSVTRADYETWDNTWGEVRDILLLMLPVLLERSAVIGFHLQYHDRFVWDGAGADFHADMVFRSNSQWLTPKVFEAKELWHSHHGFFEYRMQPHKHQLLNVLEAKLSPLQSTGRGSGTELAADVKLNHRVYHGVERAGGRPEAAKTREEIFGATDHIGLIDAYMEEMHRENKRILAQLINDRMCDQIGLERPE